MGNRIVGNFKAKLGQKPGESEETIDEDGKEILAIIRASFKKLTDGVKTFPRPTSFVGDAVISDYTELCLIAQYIDLEKYEAQHFRRLGNVLNDFPIWTEFLHGVRGIGPAMGGVIISEIDISRARYPSSLWAYAGLDVATRFRCVERLRRDAPEYLTRRHPDGYTTRGPAVVNADNTFMLYDGTCAIGKYSLDAAWEGAGLGRSRKKDHLVERAYADREGNPATRVGITFNPFLKTKLIGVLGSSFVKQPADKCKYRAIYDEYKAKLEANPKWGVDTETSKGHRHNMAVRYMVKVFLIDLYVAWRKLEGLPVAPSYAESKREQQHESEAA
jgi:hypothetical protein